MNLRIFPLEIQLAPNFFSIALFVGSSILVQIFFLPLKKNYLLSSSPPLNFMRVVILLMKVPLASF